MPDLLSDGVTDFVYGPGGVPIEQGRGGGTQWFVHDAQGSPRALLGADGTIAGGCPPTVLV